MIKHGFAKKEKLYSIWRGIKIRCLNKNHHAYKYYGGKGVSVYPEWAESYEVFREWAFQNGYKEGLTLDRINGNGNYEPSNCRWTDMTTQNRNKDIQKNNKTGCSGVYLYKKPNTYRATIGVNGKKISLGLFNTLSEAINARKDAEKKYWAV